MHGFPAEAHNKIVIQSWCIWIFPRERVTRVSCMKKVPSPDLGHAGMIAIPVEQWHWGSEGGSWEESDLLKDLMTWTWTKETCDDITDEWKSQILFALEGFIFCIFVTHSCPETLDADQEIQKKKKKTAFKGKRRNLKESHRWLQRVYVHYIEISLYVGRCSHW